MDNTSQEKFDKLVKLDPIDLSLEDKAFLKARRTYLNGTQREVFKDIIKEVPALDEEAIPYVSKKDQAKLDAEKKA